MNSKDRAIENGIKENMKDFSLLVIVNLFVGSMVGLERTVLPLIGERQFAMTSASAALSFIVSFGFTKGIVNYFAGRISDRFGRRKVLIFGWVIGLFVPLLVILAHSWWVIVLANVLLGVNQALTWSMTVNMKVDIVKKHQRGLAIGLNEAAGYTGLALAAMLSGYVAEAYSLRPEPFYLGFLFAGLGLILSTGIKSTEQHLTLQVKTHGNEGELQTSKQVFLMTTWKDRTLSVCSLAGLSTNLKDGMVWGLFPLFFSQKGLSVGEIGVLIAVYPIAWGLSQLITGFLSDWVGRKPLIVAGMFIQAIAIWWILISGAYSLWVMGAVILGVGTALVYPTLQAAISDVAHPNWRASSMGVYRFWRDSGYAFGALFAGALTDWIDMDWAIGMVAGLPLIAGFIAAIRMKETLRKEIGYENR